jgi:hypothetical protein
LDFDLEGAIRKGYVDDSRVVFEQLIGWAKDCQADDAVWMAKDGFRDPAVQRAVLKGLKKWIPGAVSNVVELFAIFRVRDRRASTRLR